MPKLRRDPNMTEKLAAMIALHLDLPRDIAKTMSAQQICALLQWDHYPVAFHTGRDLGWSDTEVHHPTNLQPLFAEDHLEKTRKRDTPQAAKGKRLTRAQEEFRARMLAKASAEPRDEPPRPGAKLRGRGFQGHRRFNGEVVVRKNGLFGDECRNMVAFPPNPHKILFGYDSVIGGAMNDVQFLVGLLGKCGDALRTPTPDEEIAALRSLVIDMGHAIRRLDDDHEHLEFWTQDGEYVLDGRFRHE